MIGFLVGPGGVADGREKDAALAYAVRPDQRMVLPHAGPPRIVGGLIRGRQNVYALVSRIVGEGIPLVAHGPAPVFRKPFSDEMRPILEVDRAQLLAGVDPELRSDEHLRIPVPGVAGVAAGAVNPYKRSAVFDVTAKRRP